LTEFSTAHKNNRVSSFSLSRLLPPLGLFILTLIWGYNWVLSKQALAYTPPMAFAAERCFLGALSLFVILKLLGRSASLVAPGPTFFIGLAQSTGFMAFQTWALVEGGPGKTAVLIFTMPIWTLLMAWPILGERIQGKQWLAALSTLTGLVLIIEPWDMHSSLFSKFLGVMAALCWAVGSILIKRLRFHQKVDLLALTAWQMMLGAVPMVLLAALIPEHATQWTVSYIWILAFISLVSTGLGWWLWVYILDRVPAWEASLSVLGTPVVAILSSRWMLGESFKISEVTGILLIGGGLILLSLLSWAASRRQ
jgi:drug/metabolite transporter (DMT)-like permease